MKITPIQVTIADLTKNYQDDGDGGVIGFDGKLVIRPAYQREFVYRDKQRDAVVMGFTINVLEERIRLLEMCEIMCGGVEED